MSGCEKPRQPQTREVLRRVCQISTTPGATFTLFAISTSAHTVINFVVDLNEVIKDLLVPNETFSSACSGEVGRG